MAVAVALLAVVVVVKVEVAVRPGVVAGLLREPTATMRMAMVVLGDNVLMTRNNGVPSRLLIAVPLAPSLTAVNHKENTLVEDAIASNFLPARELKKLQIIPLNTPDPKTRKRTQDVWKYSEYCTPFPRWLNSSPPAPSVPLIRCRFQAWME